MIAKNSLAISSQDELLPAVADAIRSVSARARTAVIAPDTRLLDDLCLDSLDMVAVILKLQDRFGCEIDPDLIPTLERVSDLAQVIRLSDQLAA